MDCFAEFIIGRRFAPTRWLAMTVDMLLQSPAPIPMSCNVTARSGGLIMSYSDSGNTGGASWRSDGGGQPHAFDPLAQPELLRGVLTRRGLAVLVSLVGLAAPGFL